MDCLPRSRRARDWTAWLGLLAMCLVVFAPLVSQSLIAARMAHARIQAIEHQICSVDTQDASSMPTHSGHESTPDGSMSACGYCNFIAGHAALPTVQPAALVLDLPALAVAVAMPPLRHIVFGTFPSGRPRAPPVFLF